MLKKFSFAAIVFAVAVQLAFGEKIGPVISLGPGILPELAYDSNGKKFFVVWVGSVPFYGRLRGTFMNLNSTHSAVQTYSTPLQQNSPSFQQVLFDSTSDRFLLVWEEKNQNVFTRLIDSEGNASTINQIYDNDKGFGVFGIFSARQNLTGEYLVDVQSAFKFILDPSGVILHKSGNIRFTDKKIFSATQGSGYSIFGSFGGNLVFQILDSEGKQLTSRKTILENGTWFPLFNDITATYNALIRQYLLLYSDRLAFSVNSIRVDAAGKIVGSAHKVAPNLLHRKEMVSRQNGYRAFFIDLSKGLFSQKLNAQGSPVGSVTFVFQPHDSFDVPSEIAVASALDQKRHLVCWNDVRSKVFCRFLYE